MCPSTLRLYDYNELKQITDINCVTFYDFHNESQLVKFVMKDVCDRYVRLVQIRIATPDNKLEQPLISSIQEEILTKKLKFIILDGVPSQH